MKVYHACLPNQGMKPGDVIAPILIESHQYYEKDSSFFKYFLSDSLSAHGLQYTSDVVCETSSNSYEDVSRQNFLISHWLIEYNLELVRRAFFPKKLTRLTSLFTIPHLEELDKWPELKGREVFEIEVEDDCCQIFDSNLLRGGIISGPQSTAFSPKLNFDCAFDYWGQKASNTPRMEALIKLPVIVGEKVKQT